MMNEHKKAQTLSDVKMIALLDRLREQYILGVRDFTLDITNLVHEELTGDRYKTTFMATAAYKLLAVYADFYRDTPDLTPINWRAVNREFIRVFSLRSQQRALKISAMVNRLAECFSDFDVNAPDYENVSLLMASLHAGQPGQYFILDLLKHGADVNAQSTRFGKPIHFIFDVNQIPIWEDVEILAAHGADPTEELPFTCYSERHNASATVYPSLRDFCEKVIQNGDKVNGSTLMTDAHLPVIDLIKKIDSSKQAMEAVDDEVNKPRTTKRL